MPMQVPTADAQMMTSHPARWMWKGSNWDWKPGHDVQRPATMAVWERGHRLQECSGGYVSIDGRWRR